MMWTCVPSMIPTGLGFPYLAEIFFAISWSQFLKPIDEVICLPRHLEKNGIMCGAQSNVCSLQSSHCRLTWCFYPANRCGAQLGTLQASPCFSPTYAASCFSHLANLVEHMLRGSVALNTTPTDNEDMCDRNFSLFNSVPHFRPVELELQSHICPTWKGLLAILTPPMLWLFLKNIMKAGYMNPIQKHSIYATILNDVSESFGSLKWIALSSSRKSQVMWMCWNSIYCGWQYIYLINTTWRTVPGLSKLWVRWKGTVLIDAITNTMTCIPFRQWMTFSEWTKNQKKERKKKSIRAELQHFWNAH